MYTVEYYAAERKDEKNATGFNWDVASGHWLSVVHQRKKEKYIKFSFILLYRETWWESR